MEDVSSSDKVLDLCLILDCTSSMGSWIQRSKETLIEIIDNVKNQNQGLKVRVCFVGYRDFCSPANERFEIQDFTTDLNKVKNFIGKTLARGGGDGPEDV